MKKYRVLGFMSGFAQQGLNFLRNYAGWVVAFQVVGYAFAYNALMPNSMYFSPDSVLYLSVSDIVPPIFALFSRALLEFELGLGYTSVVLLRYIVIAIYSIGGWLISRALIRAERPLLATFILPAIWSMSALTMWFNYFLTDGIATAFLIACIGAYANFFMSIQQGVKQSYQSWWWLALFVILGMISFSMRPAFAFIAPAMVVMMMNRVIFSWRRLVVATLSIVLLATMHFSFSNYWHGHSPSQLGGVLTALVFDLPLPVPCSEGDETNLCKTQRALEPFIQKSLSIESAHQRFIYKALNNGNVVGAARSAVTGEEPYPILKEVALIKIKSNIPEYIKMVLKNSYYSVKTWGNWYRHDNLGAVALDGITNTNNNASAVRAAARIDFDPTITEPPVSRFYKDFLFQFPRLVLGGHFVSSLSTVILLIVLFYGVYPLIYPTSLLSSMVFSCSIIGTAGIIFQNAVFPVIPRLLEPFQPLGALAFLMLIAITIDRLKARSLRKKMLLSDGLNIKKYM